MTTYLDLVSAADNFPYEATSDGHGELYIPFRLTFQDYEARLPPFGLLRPAVLDQLANECNKRDLTSDTKITSDQPLDLLVESRDDGSETIVAVCFAPNVRHDDFGPVLKSIVNDWNARGLFPNQLGNPKDEQCVIPVDPRSSYNPSSTPPIQAGQKGLTFSRDASSLFGFKAFAVHMTAYEGVGKEMKIWVPKRSTMKITFPGFLDNTVGGGVLAGATPLQAMTQECEEEANLTEDFVHQYMESTGLVSFMMRTDDGGLCTQTIYTYDMKLPNSADQFYQQPRPNDGEVEWFKLLPVAEVMAALLHGQFRPPAAVVLIDFLIRHGFISQGNEPAYQQIGWRMRRSLDLSMQNAAGKVL